MSGVGSWQETATPGEPWGSSRSPCCCFLPKKHDSTFHCVEGRRPDPPVSLHTCADSLGPGSSGGKSMQIRTATPGGGLALCSASLC